MMSTDAVFIRDQIDDALYKCDLKKVTQFLNHSNQAAVKQALLSRQSNANSNNNMSTTYTTRLDIACSRMTDPQILSALIDAGVRHNIITQMLSESPNATRAEEKTLLYLAAYSHFPVDSMRNLLNAFSEHLPIEQIKTIIEKPGSNPFVAAIDGGLSVICLKMIFNFCKERLSHDKLAALLEQVDPFGENIVMKAVSRRHRDGDDTIDSLGFILDVCARNATTTTGGLDPFLFALTRTAAPNSADADVLMYSNPIPHQTALIYCARSKRLTSLYLLCAYFSSPLILRQAFEHKDAEGFSAVSFAKKSEIENLLTDKNVKNSTVLWKTSIRMFRDRYGGEFPAHMKRMTNTKGPVSIGGKDDSNCAVQ